MFDFFKKRKEKKIRSRKFHDKYRFEMKDPYSYIILQASQKLGAHLNRYGIEPRFQETSRQYLVRASQLEGIDDKALLQFLLILEEVQYSDHKIGEDHKNRAIGTLRSIEKSLERSSGEIRKEKMPIGDLIIIPPPMISEYYDDLRYPESMELRKDRGERSRSIHDQFSTSEKHPERQGTIPTDILMNFFRGEDNDFIKGIMEEVEDPKKDGIWLSMTVSYYILEIFYRMIETNILPDDKAKEYLNRMILYSKSLAKVEPRDYVIPDDVKIAIINSLPGFNMIDRITAIRLIDSVQVPSILNDLVRM